MQKNKIRTICSALFIWGVFLVFFSCGKNKVAEGGGTSGETLPDKEEFRMVDIPAELTEAKDRARFLITHYWDNFDFNDTSYIHKPDVTEQIFANYIDMLSHGEKGDAYASIKGTLSKAQSEPSGKVYSYFLETCDKYLYDPNSPLRNEEFYIPVAEYVIGDSTSSDADKERAKFRHSMMLKNRVGDKAANFSYTLESGKVGYMYDVDAEYTLLYFYNPDCNACEEIIGYMKQSTLIASLIDQKRLKVLAVYPDKDLSIWKKHLDNMPHTWINGYDRHTAVSNKRIYDLRAIPTIYLLDRNKLVILKDAEILAVEHYLGNLFGVNK